MPPLDTGSWRVTPIETGFLWLDGGSMFGSVPKPIWSKLQPPDERSLARGARIVEQTLGPSAASVVERGAAFLRRELAARAVAGARS